jgi:hypothetical protein
MKKRIVGVLKMLTTDFKNLLDLCKFFVKENHFKSTSTFHLELTEGNHFHVLAYIHMYDPIT